MADTSFKPITIRLRELYRDTELPAISARGSGRVLRSASSASSAASGLEGIEGLERFRGRLPAAERLSRDEANDVSC